MRSEVIRCVRPASDCVNEIRRVPTCCQRVPDDADKEARGPSGVLRGLDNDSISCEEGRNDWAEEVMELQELVLSDVHARLILQDNYSCQQTATRG